MGKSVLFVNWKDIKNPETGGAEIVADELCKRLIKDGYEVTFLTSKFKNSLEDEVVNGYNVIRKGKYKFTLAFAGLWYYLCNLRNKYDIIIDTVNTVPYFIGFFRGKAKYFLFYHQLAEEVWEYQMKFPFSKIGRFVLEPVATWLNSCLKVQTVTISQSTKDNLSRYGFKKENIHIISEGIQINPLDKVNISKKEKIFTVLFLSALRKMKRPDHAIKAFIEANKTVKNIRMWIAGGGEMDYELKMLVKQNNLENKVTFYGRVSEKKKVELLQKASVLVSTSIKEGWGLIVTEANSQGTPAIGYNVDGLRDALSQGGNLISNDNITDLSTKIILLEKDFNRNNNNYIDLIKKVHLKSKKINFNNAYKDFKKIIL
jgi:glycosyltransferase involved in cell wall biosynthesis